jgi:hypothetical protein
MDYSRPRKPKGRQSAAILRPNRGEGRDGSGFSSASPRTFVRELAVGLEPAFVDAFKALGDHGLQFPDLVLVLGVFRIHQLFCFDVSGNATDDGRRCRLA